MWLNQLLFRSHLEKGEKISLVIHRHPMVIQKKLIRAFFLGMVLPAIFYVLVYVPPFNYLFLAWGILGLIRIFYISADWFFDGWLITNQSIILVEWNGFFNCSQSRVEFQTIEDIAYEISGFWETMLKCGTLTISRFGSPHPTVMKKCWQPRKAERGIIRAQGHFMENKSFRDHEILKDLISGMIQQHTKKVKK